MGDLVCKFGGTSLADAACIHRAESIIRQDPRRRFVVPSAPGKRHAEDRKITDLLYAWHGITSQGLDASEPRNLICARYEQLVSDLGIDLDIAALISEIEAQAPLHKEPDFMASRGEYLNGRIIAVLLGATFVDPAEAIRFNALGQLDEHSYEVLADRLRGPGMFVVPGFYGAMPDGTVKTFSRGGSDISGAIVARAVHASCYENWSDVSGFLMADPRIVENPREIEEITYQELRELSYMGATVLHDEAIFPVRNVGIPINLRNTWNPDHPGTRIVPTREATEPVVGIAGRAGFSMINVEKAFMNKERGFGLRMLRVLEDHDVSWEHMPTGIDTISLIVRDEELGQQSDTIIEAIRSACKPDQVAISPGLAIIATVGLGMNHHVGVAARLCTALSDAGINIRVIDQGSSEMNIIIGVEEGDLHAAVRALYNAFANWQA